MRSREHRYVSAVLVCLLPFAGCGRTSEPQAPRIETSTTQRSKPEEPRPKLELGEPIELPKEPRTRIMVSSAQFEPSCIVEQDGVPFTVGARDGRIVFVSCNAEGFELPGGEVVGVTRFEELTDSQRQRIVEERGYAFYIPSEEGWNLAWMESPSGDDVVGWAFKRASN